MQQHQKSNNVYSHSQLSDADDDDDVDEDQQSDEINERRNYESSLSQSSDSSDQQARQKESDEELKVDFNELMFGDEIGGILYGYDMNQINELKGSFPIMQEDDKKNVNQEKTKQDNPENEDIRKNPPPTNLNVFDSSSSSDEEIKYELPVMFAQNRYGESIRVIQFTNIFIPDKGKKQDNIRLFNQRCMQTQNEAQNEQEREKRRKLKEDYKNLSQILNQKAAFLPVNPFLEDFFYLNNRNKYGAPVKRVPPQTQANYRTLLPDNPLIQKINQSNQQQQSNLKRKLQRQTVEKESNTNIEFYDHEKQMMIESCRVEELQKNFLKGQSIKQAIQKDFQRRFPAPRYSTFEKQIFAHTKNHNEGTNLKYTDITDNMVQEGMMEQRYSMLRQDQGLPVKRVKYWGELKDASSVQQLERDSYICQKYEVKSQQIFRLKIQSEPGELRNSTLQKNMIENFKEYENIKKNEEQLFQGKKSQVTARSIMRFIRHKMGLINDEQFYQSEIADLNVTGSIANAEMTADNTHHSLNKLKKVKFLHFEENLDVHFNQRRQQMQTEIFEKKNAKEQANQQSNKISTTTAYEPISALEPILKEKAAAAAEQPEINEAKNERHSDQSVSSSSDSDDEQKDYLDKVQRPTGERVLPTLGDELNHAKCIKDLSFYKLNWEDKDLSNFHRPNIQMSISPWKQIQTVAVSAKKIDQEKRLNPHDYFKDRFKLSLNKGKFCIFEHIDQNPLFVNNFGMASRLKRYFYDDKQPSKKIFYQRQENKGTRHMGPHGEIVLKGQPKFVDPSKPKLGLQPDRRLELLGQINTTKYQGIAVLENKMYNAPVFYHSSGRTDFFCSLVRNKTNNEQKIVVRELDSLYTVGQIEPKLEVNNPQSRQFQNFIKQRAKAYIIRFLQENAIIKFADIVDFFPQIREQILKNSLKESEIDIDRNGECKFTEKFDEERFKERMTPEMICQYESARHGQYRLQQIGITEILSADKISSSMNKFNREETDVTLRRVAKLIESEVLSSPWNLSSSFIKVKQDSSMMLLNGVGDPSFGHGGYSFIKMPLKISGDSIQGAKENRMNLNPAIKNPKAVTRTDADLRKLQKKVIYENLINQGMTTDQLNGKTRWQMVGMLRHYAPNNPENKKFARGVRYTSNKQREKYNTNANDKFEQQMNNLSSYSPDFIHQFSDDEPDFTKDDPNKQTRPGQGQNADDFTDYIRILTQEQVRKLSVETTMDQVKNIQKIEDIPNYLNLLLLKLDRMPPCATAQNQNTAIGGASATQITVDFLESLNQDTIDDLKKILLEKLNSGEINKKQHVICKMIRSLANDQCLTDIEIDDDNLQPYTRVIFCSSEKVIKKFDRARKKNEGLQRVPRAKKISTTPSGVASLATALPPGLTTDQLISGTKKSGGSNASRSRSGNAIEMGNNVMTGSNIYAGAINKSKPSKSTTPSKKKKPKVEVALPLIKVNYTAATNSQSSVIAIPISNNPQYSQPQNNNKMTISLKVQPEFINEQDQEMAVEISDQEQQDENDVDLNNEENYVGDQADDAMMGEESQEIIQQRNQISQRFNMNVTASKQLKQRKLKKQPSTSRFKQHGFAKEDFDYHQPMTNNRSHRKRQQQSDQALNQIFADILQSMMDKDRNQYFHNQVTKQDAPNYRDLIKKPICLKDMKNRTKRNEYKGREDFLKDVELMRNNSQIFNGILHPITQAAVELEEVATREIQSKIDEILNLETLVKEVVQAV